MSVKLLGLQLHMYLGQGQVLADYQESSGDEIIHDVQSASKDMLR